MAKSNGRYHISLFSFVMITSAAIISIRIFPTEGIIWWQTILFNVLAVVIYLIPCALVAAELASGWPGKGGSLRLGEGGLRRTMGFHRQLDPNGSR